ncbi:MAG TPA: hypothetical protein VFW73_11930 [Lacipirellulaceae bacterium]|nr:hypothetical protein [Lacipirellulaceae bacterium]
MLHFKAHGRCAQRWFASAAWGRPVCYVEVAVDQRATRLVQVFDNGNILSYDRTHWCDDFGQLLGLRFSRKPKWRVFFPDAELIDLAEFERVWSAALQAPLHKEQLARSRLDKWGPYQVSA